MLKRRWTLALALACVAGAALPALTAPLSAPPRTRGFGVRPQAPSPTPTAALRADSSRQIGWGHREENWISDNIRVDARVRRQPTAAEQVEGEWIARLRPGASPESVARRLGCRVERATDLPDTYVFSRDPEASVAAMANVAAVAGELVYVEPNRICRVCDIPNDPEYNNQWGLRMVKMPDAWALQKGTVDSFNPGITVAVVDTGVNLIHQDLRDRVLPGYNLLPNGGPSPSDDNGHGTHVAGIIAASTNNQIGVAGVAWEGVKILPIKAFDYDGATSLEILAAGIRRAADAGAHVINVSAGTEVDSATVRDAVRYALARPQKPILVAASGNESSRQLGKVLPVIYPANYPDPRVIAVGAVGPDGTIAFYSNANASPPSSTRGGVDIVAPGGNDPSLRDNPNLTILSTDWSPLRPEDAYGYMQGTSFSAPFVSGAVALLLSEGLAPEDVESALYASADRRGASGRTETYGWGVLNVSGALQMAAVLPRVRWPLAGYPVETATTLLLADILNAPGGNIQVRLDGEVVAGVTTRALDGRTQQIIHRPSLAAGTHSLEVTATSPVTGRTRSAFVEFEVAPKVLQPGWHLLALPYTLSTGDPATIFGGKPFRMARWIASSGEYAFYDPPTQRQDARASFRPTGVGLAGSPAGLGYWVKLTEATTLSLPGDPVLDPEYRIPLAKGWSIVGNPYVFPVGLSGIRYQVGNQTVTLAQAIQKGWLGRNIYAYVSGSTSNPYVALSATSGVLTPYQAAWFQAGTAGTLIIPGG
jgi:subtilisin family serine protease